jgi:hypothetical protein
MEPFRLMSKKNPNLLKLKEALGVSYHKAYGIEKNGKSFKFFITKCIVFSMCYHETLYK